jgi:hypothetical protein
MMNIQKIDEKIPDVISKEGQSKELTASSLPESVLQILKDLGCPQPEAVGTLEKNVSMLKVGPGVKLVYSILLLGTAIVLAVAAIALVIFGHIFSGIALVLCAAVVVVGARIILSTMDEAIDKIGKMVTADVHLISEWGKQVGEKYKEDNVSEEQKNALVQANHFAMSIMNNASKNIK